MAVRRFRAGFTLIEALTAMGILSLLVGLLMPAVQSAREAARRAGCANNLRQIGLALHAYHAVHQSFPPNWSGGLPVTSHTFETVRAFSALTRILPYAEHQALYSAINYMEESDPTAPSFPHYAANLTAYLTQVGLFLCPSDSWSEPTAHGTNYRGNYGVGPSTATCAETYDSGNGFFNYPTVLKSASFPDGLAHTVAYGERLKGTGRSTRIAPERDFGDLSHYPYAVERDADYALAWCRVAAASGFPASRNAGFTWLFGDFECSAFNHAQEPNGSIPDAIETKQATYWGIVTARSLHPGGVNTLMADGSTRFVTQSIHRKAWRALGTRNGGELAE